MNHFKAINNLKSSIDNFRDFHFSTAAEYRFAGIRHESQKRAITLQ